MPTTGRLDFDQLSFMWKFLKNRIGKRKKQPQNDPPNPAYTQQLLCKVNEMTNLTFLTVGCYPSDDWRLFNKATAFLDAAWEHASRLRQLRLDLPLECIHTVLSTIPYFHDLEDLHISIRVESISETHTDTMSRLITFINLQSSTLVRMAIDVPSLQIDPSPLFYGINCMPKLMSVAIELPSDLLQIGLNGAVDAFLAKHRASLRGLQVSFNESAYSYNRPTPITFFSCSLFQLSFPSLKTLDLGICYWNFRIDTSLSTELVKYLSKFRCTITELAISNDTLCFPVIQQIVLLFGGADTILRCLKIRVHYLSCDLLDLLSRDLPRLYELVLDFNSIRDKDDGCADVTYRWEKVDLVSLYLLEFFSLIRPFSIQLDAISFVGQLGLRRYPMWALRHLTLRGPQFNCAGIWNKGRVKLVASLPNVLTFNGLSGAEFLAIPDYTELAAFK